MTQHRIWARVRRLPDILAGTKFLISATTRAWRWNVAYLVAGLIVSLALPGAIAAYVGQQHARCRTSADPRDVAGDSACRSPTSPVGCCGQRGNWWSSCWRSWKSARVGSTIGGIAPASGLVAVAPERPVLLGRTIRDALTYGQPEHSADSVVAAARAVGIDKLIARLPGGYDTPLTDAAFSLGELQRLGLVRGIDPAAPGSSARSCARSSLDRAQEHDVMTASRGSWAAPE